MGADPSLETEGYWAGGGPGLRRFERSLVWFLGTAKTGNHQTNTLRRSAERRW